MKRKPTMSECRVYVASLCDYNAGVLFGAWIDASDPATMQAEIAAMLAESPTAKVEGREAEEYAIHDHEGFDGVRVSEYADLYTLCTIAEGVREHGDAFLAWVANAPNDNTDKDDFEDDFRGEYDSLADYVQEYWEESGQMPKAPDGQWWSPANYIDWERMANDLEMSGDVWTADAPGGKVWVFESR
jgi:antirestriction protein